MDHVQLINPVLTDMDVWRTKDKVALSGNNFETKGMCFPLWINLDNV
jgi:hypothetical protein